MTAEDVDAPAAPRPAHRRALRGDCERCLGLCCVAPALAASADFAIDKPAGSACPNLTGDLRCGIHSRLRAAGFPGCKAYDCFGAGQQVTQVTLRGEEWRSAPDGGTELFAVFAVMRDLHELLWHLEEALLLPRASEVHTEVREALGKVRALTGRDAGALRALDRGALRRRVHVLLLRVSELARAGTPPGADFARADLLGADLRGQDLRRASLFAACLIGADLSGADLSGADLRGADLRGAKLSGADLTACLFLAPAQVEGARGDGATRLPGSVVRPEHWG